MLALGAYGYPSGAPEGACSTLNPDSHGPSTATGPCPYNISMSSSSYTKGQMITLTLVSTSGAEFKGYLIEGRVVGKTENESIGYFKTVPAGAKTLCMGKYGNSVTHTNNTVKKTVAFQWEAPGPEYGDIQFHFTVVRGGAPATKVDPADYWMDVKSGVLSPSKQLTFEPEAVLSRDTADFSSRQQMLAELSVYGAEEREDQLPQRISLVDLLQRRRQ